jgi:hypothetical protein
MKNRIIEICELGQPQSIIHREDEPISELIRTTDLVEELNEQLLIPVVVGSFVDKEKQAYEAGFEDGCTATANDFGSRL